MLHSKSGTRSEARRLLSVEKQMKQALRRHIGIIVAILGGFSASCASLKNFTLFQLPAQNDGVRHAYKADIWNRISYFNCSFLHNIISLFIRIYNRLLEPRMPRVRGLHLLCFGDDSRFHHLTENIQILKWA